MCNCLFVHLFMACAPPLKYKFHEARHHTYLIHQYDPSTMSGTQKVLKKCFMNERANPWLPWGTQGSGG